MLEGPAGIGPVRGPSELLRAPFHAPGRSGRPDRFGTSQIQIPDIVSWEIGPPRVLRCMEYIASAADSDTDPSCMRLLPGVAKSLARSVGPPKAARTLSAAAASEMWKSIPMGAPDPILGLVEAFKKDDNPKKVSLSAGTYRTDEGSHLVLPSIKTAEDRVVAANYDKEYLPITGLQARAPPPHPFGAPPRQPTPRPAVRRRRSTSARASSPSAPTRPPSRRAASPPCRPSRAPARAG